MVALKEGSWIHWSAAQASVCTGGLGLLKQFGSMKVVYIAILNSLVLFQVLRGGVVPQGGEYPLISGFSIQANNWNLSPDSPNSLNLTLGSGSLHTFCEFKAI